MIWLILPAHGFKTNFRRFVYIVLHQCSCSLSYSSQANENSFLWSPIRVMVTWGEVGDVVYEKGKLRLQRYKNITQILDNMKALRHWLNFQPLHFSIFNLTLRSTRDIPRSDCSCDLWTRMIRISNEWISKFGVVKWVRSLTTSEAAIDQLKTKKTFQRIG